MPVLIVVTLAYLFFFAVVGLIAVAEIADRRERRRRKLVSVHTPLLGLSVTQAFDPAFAPLWEAQIPALERISKADFAGVPLRRLNRSFAGVTGRFPEIFEGCGIEQWVLFLQQEELVLWFAGRVRITDKGREFLRFRFICDVSMAGKE